MSQQKTNAQKVFSETKIFTNFKIKNKMKNLQEMSLNEMRKTEGGNPGIVAALVWAFNKGLELGKKAAS